MDSANFALMQKDDASLERLSKICLPSRSKRTLTRALRPERPECTTYMQVPPSPAWTRALQHIQRGVLLGEGSVDVFCRRMRDRRLDKNVALRAVATIMYDQECSGILIPETIFSPLDLTLPALDYLKLSIYKTSFGIRPLIEHMLLVDYRMGVYPLSGHPFIPNWLYRRYIWPGIDQACKYVGEVVYCCRLGQLPERKVWERLGTMLMPFDRCIVDISDIAIMLYYYHTHHRQLGPTDYKDGVTGYTGIMQELRDEVSTRGPDRLIRKLSVDINYLIPRFVFSSDRQDTMRRTAQSIAAQYNICTIPSIPQVNGWPGLDRRSRWKDTAPPPAYSP
jgi:hypothetical protein